MKIVTTKIRPAMTQCAVKILDILLVEDDPDDVGLFERLIVSKSQRRYNVRVLDSLEGALAEVNVKKPDALLLDLSLPDSHGVETLNRFREANSFVPVVVLTGNVDGEMGVQALRKGAQDYLVKGEFSAEVLDRTIVHSIEKMRMERELDELRAKNQNSAKMIALGRLAGGIAHEINTPLGIIMLNGDVLKGKLEGEKLDPKNCLPYVDSIIETTDHIAKIVKSLKIYSREDEESPKILTKVRDIVDRSCALCVERFKNDGIDFKIVNNFERDDELNCNSVEICQVIVNLLNNAYDAIEELEEKWIRFETLIQSEAVCFKIVDCGAGVAPEVANKLFDPFFSTKGMDKGTGIGLSISKGIVDAHGGKIYLDEESPNTCFVVQLPRT